MKYSSLWKGNTEKMNTAGFLSGDGSNMRKILEYQKENSSCPYCIKVLFSDYASSKAAIIGSDFDIPVLYRDIKSFYYCNNVARNDLSLRHLFDAETKMILEFFHISAIALAGYMSVLSSVLTDNFLCINVHPANLTVEENGKRKYIGLHAVEKAIHSAETELRSTTHIVNGTIDGGELLMVSEPLTVRNDWNALQHQQRLKEIGDWKIFPLTLALIAHNKFTRNSEGKLCYNEQCIEKGINFRDI